ncbi:hypothetical protein [Pontibacter sp. SGAir0037]|uniref:hypothetical protein n=1 Tax=Pontibacter sp. SGAir0037 TaxID=2571030 RepID=UPI0010CCC00E|nr:hypothetical protein [Pontibacter sp. SGAir0037]QCR22704.1 hypothetical protein C1N53_10340 [Pontibacter sp. SGAir0037]
MKGLAKFTLCFALLFCLVKAFGTDKKRTEPEERILLNNSKDLRFSSTQSLDNFTIILKGEEILEGVVTFSIKTSSGKTIYKESFPARDLIGYEIVEESPTKEQEEEVVKRRIREFFIEDNFSSPAIATDEKYEEDYAEKSIWKDIKADRTAVGFFYKIGEEDMRWIAYSKKAKKVVMYHNCC